MRRLRYSVAMTLDGYIAGPAGEADWIVTDPDIDFDAIFSEFDTLLMGRRTFAAMAGSGSPAGSFGDLKIVVASRTLDSRHYPRVTIVADHLKEAVTALKQEQGKDIWLFGGGELFRSLLDFGLVDTVEVAVIPHLLGGGIPLLPSPARQAKLELTRHVLYPKSGIVLLAYDVLQAPSSKRRARRSARAMAAEPRPSQGAAELASK
jgi:dihydrofolate reductase